MDRRVDRYKVSIRREREEREATGFVQVPFSEQLNTHDNSNMYLISVYWMNKDMAVWKY